MKITKFTRKKNLSYKGLSDENIKKAFELYAESKKKPAEQPANSNGQGKADESPVQTSMPVMKSECISLFFFKKKLYYN